MNSRYFEVNEEGCNIRAKIYFSDIHNIKKVILCFHGFGGHKDNKSTEKLAERVTSKYKGIAVITFNWPCHGDDVRKRVVLSDCDTYLRLMLKYINEKYGVERPYAHGVSFGGYMVLKYINQYGNPFDKIVLRSPAIDMYESLTERIMKNDDFDKLEAGKDVAVGFDRKVFVNKDFIEEIKKNDVRKMDFLDYADDLLIIHGNADEIIPCEISKQLAEDNVIEFIEVEGADHRFSNPLKMEIVIKSICEFMNF